MTRLNLTDIEVMVMHSRTWKYLFKLYYPNHVRVAQAVVLLHVTQAYNSNKMSQIKENGAMQSEDLGLGHVPWTGEVAAQGPFLTLHFRYISAWYRTFVILDTAVASVTERWQPRMAYTWHVGPCPHSPQSSRLDSRLNALPVGSQMRSSSGIELHKIAQQVLRLSCVAGLRLRL